MRIVFRLSLCIFFFLCAGVTPRNVTGPDVLLGSAFAAVPKDQASEDDASSAETEKPESESESDEAGEGEESASPSPTETATPTATPVPRVQPIKFGLILPLSGPQAEWGKLMQNSAKMAFEDIDAETKLKMSLIFEDDQLKPALATSAFKKLSETDKVAGFASFSGDVVAAVAPLAEKAEIPMFAITSNKDVVKGNLYSFRHWLDSAEQIRTLIPFMTEHEIHTVAIAVVAHESMQDYVAKFAVAAAQANINLVLKEEFSPSEADFKKFVSKTSEEPVDAILIALLPPQVSAFTKRLRDNGNDSPLFGFASIEIVSEVKAAVGAMDGLIYTAPKLSKDFVKRYQERYGEYPEISAPNVYDIVRIFGDAVKSGAKDSRSVANYIRRLKDYHGVMGSYSITGENDFSISSELKKIERGSFRRIDE